MFEFVNRDEELDRQRDSFFNIVNAQNGCISYLIRGKRGIGKTRLINEFINRIENDPGICNLPRFKKFKKEKHLMGYTCIKEKDEPFEPFIYKKRDKDISHAKIFNILIKVFMIIIKFFVGSILVEDMKALGKEVKERASDDSIQKREIKIYRKYLKMLRRFSKRAPLILYIQNVQWIDMYSMELLKMIIETENAMFGMIILEESGAYTHTKIKEALSKLIEKKKMREMKLRPLTRESISRILKNEFGEKLFTYNEYNNIYSSTYGCPGLLDSNINYWKAQNWIYESGDTDRWEKIENFNEKIKQDYETLFGYVVDKFNSPPNPGDIDRKQMEKILEYAAKHNADEAAVVRMNRIIATAHGKGYEISYRIGKGVFSDDVYLAKKDNENYTVEYIQNVPDEDNKIQLAEMEDINSKFYRPKDILRYESDILIIYPYLEGQQSQEFTKDQIINRNREVLDISLQVVRALAELHNNKIVHGHLRPESIMISEGKKVHIAIALNSNIYKSMCKKDPEKHLDLISYFSPEHIQGKPIDAQTDIFLFGTVIYELLTGKRLFEGKSVKDIEYQIRNIDNEIDRRGSDIIHNQYWHVLKKCLKQNPEERYKNVSRLEKDLKDLKTKMNGFPEDEEPQPIYPGKNKVVHSHRKKIILSTAALFLIAAAALISICPWCEPPCNSLHVVQNTIVIDHVDIQNTSKQLNPLAPDMLKYLLTNTIHQSSEKNVISGSEFDLSHNKGTDVPELRISAVIKIKPIGYQVKHTLEIPCKGTKEISIDFVDPSALVREKIKKITGTIFSEIGHEVKEIFTLTESWNAFEAFFKGEKEWRRLNLTAAKQEFKSALVYDNHFVLAKLRLAQVYRFIGRNLKAVELIDEITPDLNRLSRLQSLKAQALGARLKGKNLEEISILTEIFEGFPYKKESSYDVAEAYYELCNVEKAIYYYEMSLKIDNTFEKAHNHLAYCYSHLGDHENAINHFNTSLKLDKTANAYDSLGDGYMAAGELEKAETAKKQGIEIDDQLSYLWGSLGFINIRQGKLIEAQTNIRRYMELANGNDRNAEGYFRLAFANFVKRDFETSLRFCSEGIQTYDSDDIVTRNHDLHWLLGLLYFQLEQADLADNEIIQMEELVNKHNINATNYRQKIYKNLLHLKAVKAARTGHIEDLSAIIEEFDGPIKDKLKDHGSPFDLAFFNTCFGELLMREPLNRLPLAEQRFKIALNYNPNYALAHYNLWKLYLRTGDNQQAQHHLDTFRNLWKEADPDVREVYGIGE